ncbi:hypothetical protein EV363DRAFT_1175996 [Boletus edulis]|uniref:Uncharacterized protein n=1 Tax=Boletus edulis BED1 TaxID=1328754 RepID=A0AAD4GAJ2_BOLED|nr:hypothetical protein EV363DRAFT_1175996 [Boletus edulis]KAF8432238.1 hypothetical protein L210DRAFT_951752 [Boletus edulis BED1]
MGIVATSMLRWRCGNLKVGSCALVVVIMVTCHPNGRRYKYKDTHQYTISCNPAVSVGYIHRQLNATSGARFGVFIDRLTVCIPRMRFRRAFRLPSDRADSPASSCPLPVTILSIYSHFRHTLTLDVSPLHSI